MKRFNLLTALAFAAVIAGGTPVRAEDAPATCADQSAAKKLAGAAKTSFMKKCSSDAAKTCDANAADKKLAGAAKNSFVKKCVNDAVGS